MKEEFVCETCEMIQHYVDLVMKAEDRDELFAILQSLYDEGHADGFVEAIELDLHNKIQILNGLRGCDCEDCDCCE
jgi:hypothetical protein